MSILYNISFTTKKLIYKYDTKGKQVGEPSELATPIVMNMLPHSTAMSYSGCDNFTIEQYVPENRGIKTSERKGLSNGTKKVDWAKASSGASSTGKSKAPAKSTALQQAAKTGDMASAVNG